LESLLTRPPALRRSLSAWGVVALLTLLLAGCSATNPIATAGSYEPSDGSGAELDGVRAGNLILLTAEQGASGTLLGFLTNSRDRAAEVSLDLPDGTSIGSVRLEAGETVILGPDGDTELTVESVPAPPGAYLDVTMTTGSGSVPVSVPVLDGTFSQYADLVPDE
jgi:hypothetical protein